MYQSKNNRLLLFIAITLTGLISSKFILFPKYKGVLIVKNDLKLN